MKKKLLLQGIAAMFFSQICFSQTIKIVDKSDLQPINRVSVYTGDNSKSVISDVNGVADISAFNNSDTLYLKHIAYQEEKFSKNDLINKMKGIVYLSYNIVKLDAVVLSANKIEENISDVPNKIEVISSKEIALLNPQNAGEILQQSGKVFVQTSQIGGGSPILRGFEANKVLLVIDGVRMNNAIYRSGHVHNIITIDPTVLDNVEIVYGPGSVIYGSDALGGVMHFTTKKPILSSNDKAYTKVNVFSRYSSANSEKAGGVNFNIGFKKFASFTAFSYKDLEDTKTGTVRNPAYGTWGKCLYYAERFNGVDSMVVNPDPDVQVGTGYSQYDFLQKFYFKPGEKSSYTLNFQLSNSSDIPRYDRLTQWSKGKLKYAEWYYGPQVRMLTALRSDYTSDKGFYDNAAIILAHQNISEDRISRLFGKTDRTHQEETVNVLSLNVDLRKTIKEKNEFRYGVEAFYNQVGSVAYYENVDNGEITYNAATRYPDKSGTMNTMAAYLTHNWKISDKVIFSQSIRYSNIAMKTEYTDTMMTLMDFSFNKVIEQNNGAMNYNLGLVYKIGKGWRITGMSSSGFRAPNIDDVGKVNDSKGKDHMVIVPNPGLKPEYSYNQEITINKTFNEKVHIEGTVFYTSMKDAIALRETTFNGADSIEFQGYMCKVYTNTNAGEAYLYGSQANLLAQLTDNFSISSNLTYTYGRVKVESGDTPMEHIPPVYGATNFKLEIKKFTGEFYVRYNRSKALKNYCLVGEDNLETTPSYIDADGNTAYYGIPAWYTLNLKTAYQVNKNISLLLGVENILDDHYRYFASGTSAPGRNFIAALKCKF